MPLQMIEPETRDKILASPEALLEDRDVMNALVAAHERAMGSNIVDLRAIAMERMGARLDRLEETHRSVIAAAYENISGTALIHRAVLQLLEPLDFEGFLALLNGALLQSLRVDAIRLVLESRTEPDGAAFDKLGAALVLAEPNFVEEYCALHRPEAPREVILRQMLPPNAELYGEKAADIKSEALLRLDLGEGRLPGLLVLGSENPHQFRSSQGSDLLGFFGAVFERVMRRFLS